MDMFSLRIRSNDGCVQFKDKFRSMHGFNLKTGFVNGYVQFRDSFINSRMFLIHSAKE